jgi:hypothetical protein
MRVVPWVGASQPLPPGACVVSPVSHLCPTSRNNAGKKRAGSVNSSDVNLFSFRIVASRLEWALGNCQT